MVYVDLINYGVNSIMINKLRFYGIIALIIWQLGYGLRTFNTLS